MGLGHIDRMDWFSAEAGLSQHKSAVAGTDAVDAALLDRTRPVLDRMDPLDADLLECYFVRGCRQTDLAYLFGCSQATISHRIQAALRRLRLHMTLLEVDEDLLEADLRALPQPPADGHGRRRGPIRVDVMMSYWRGGNQSEAGRDYGLVQSTVSRIVLSGIRILDEAAAAGHPRTAAYAALYRRMQKARVCVLWGRPGRLGMRRRVL